MFQLCNVRNTACTPEYSFFHLSKGKSVMPNITFRLCSHHLCYKRKEWVGGGGTVICYRCSRSLFPWAFTSSYAKHVLLSSDSSTVCCRDTFFLHFIQLDSDIYVHLLCAIERHLERLFPPVLFSSSLTSFPFFSPDKNINADLHATVSKPLMNTWIFGNTERKKNTSAIIHGRKSEE